MGMRLSTTMQITQQGAHLIECLHALGLCLRPLTALSGIEIVLILPGWWHAFVAPQTVEQTGISAYRGNTSLPRGGSSLHEGKRRGKGGDGEGGRGEGTQISA